MRAMPAVFRSSNHRAEPQAAEALRVVSGAWLYVAAPGGDSMMVGNSVMGGLLACRSCLGFGIVNRDPEGHASIDLENGIPCTCQAGMNFVQAATEFRQQGPQADWPHRKAAA